MTTTTRVTDWLEQRKVPYEVLAHQKAYTAQEVAGTVHVPGRAYAKVVMLRGERGLAMAVLPAKCRVNLARMQQLLGDRSLTLAKENDFAGTFSDCEIGAMSAFGNLYGVPVYLDRDLLGEETITFPAGNHHEVIRIGSRDFLGLTGAQVVEFCEGGQVNRSPGRRVDGRRNQGVRVMDTPAITVRPVGYVRCSDTGDIGVEALRREPVAIIVNPELAPGLEGIERFQKLVVLFYCHRTLGYALHVHPRGDLSRAARGVFASRSPARPNPLGLTVVTLLGVEGNVLHVRGLDALDGTPVLDIKPFDPTFDLGMDPPVMVSHARTPRTCAAGACPRSGSRRFIEERG